ncbi:MAG: type II toxin-antitoxin system Phd/YefM family antitoxin [Thermoleophilaceae bacterium]|nr:type II toxin-antitoxin system Phd/YefM family antitoxin [Thermoleophilaceae bacterium]
MESVGIRDMRQNLSRYLARARRGESFEVTDRGTPVARLVPSQPAGDPIAWLVEELGAIPPEPGNLLDIEPYEWDGPPSEVLIRELRRDKA